MRKTALLVQGAVRPLGNVQQQVKYKIEGSVFTLITDFGDFAYEIHVKDQEITLDGVTYRK